LTRTTAILAALFMALSLTLGLLARGGTGPTRSILDSAPASAPMVPPPPTGPSAPTN